MFLIELPQSVDTKWVLKTPPTRADHAAIRGNVLEDGDNGVRIIGLKIKGSSVRG